MSAIQLMPDHEAAHVALLSPQARSVYLASGKTVPAPVAWGAYVESATADVVIVDADADIEAPTQCVRPRYTDRVGAYCLGGAS